MPAIFRGAMAVLFLTAFSMAVSAQAVETYRVKKSDTWQTVGDRYGLTQDELLEYNKDFKDKAIEKGDVLIVPSKKERKERERQKALDAERQSAAPAPAKPVEFATHLVAPKETVYGISHKWGITQEQLRQYNPVLDTSVLKIGMELKIPVFAPGEKPAEIPPVASIPTKGGAVDNNVPPSRMPQTTDTLAPLPVSAGLRADTARAYAAAQLLDVKRPLHVDVMLPFYLDKVDSLSGAPATERLRDSNVGLSFYMGVRMALDSLSRQGLVADVRVFDTARDTTRAADILSYNDFSQTDVVIGPLYAEVTERVAASLRPQGTLVVSPFSARHDVTVSTNILQVSASEDDMMQAVFDYLQQKLPQGRRVVVLASNTQQGVQINKIKKALASKAVGGSVEVINTDLGENVSRLAAAMGAVEGLVIVAPTLTSSTMVEVLQAAGQAGRKGGTEVYAFDVDARARKQMEDVKNQASSSVRFVFADRRYDNPASAQYSEFVRAFRRMYHEMPNSYSISGFDITYDLLSRLALDRDDEQALTARRSQQVSDRYRFIRYSGGGYLNTEVFILSYAPGKGVSLLR